MTTRARLVLLVAVLAGALVGCSSDTLVESTTANDEVAAGLQAWRAASADHARADRDLRIAQGVQAWRQATAERARIDRLAEIEQLRAQSKVAGEQLRSAQAAEAIELLRAQSKVGGDTLRVQATAGTELAEKHAIRAARTAQGLVRLAEIERLRAEAKVAGDQLRLQANQAVVWTEVGPVTVDRHDWADQVAALVANGSLGTGDRDVGHSTFDTCNQPRVVAFTVQVAAQEAGQCPASSGLWMPPAPTLVISSMSIEQVERIPWALDLFDRGGLQLPDLEFRGQASAEACFGRDAAARHIDGRSVIFVCVVGDGPNWDWVLMHELGHAWSTWSAEPDRRELFTSVRSLASWRDGSWHERAAEHASEILVWGLIDRPVVPGHLYNTSCIELEVAYRALTGLEPPQELRTPRGNEPCHTHGGRPQPPIEVDDSARSSPA